MLEPKPRSSCRRVPALCALALATAALAASACQKRAATCMGAGCGAPDAAIARPVAEAGPMPAHDAAAADAAQKDAARPEVMIPAGACVPDGPSADAGDPRRSVLATSPHELRALAASTSGIFVSDPDAGIFRWKQGASTLERAVVTSGVGEILAADLHLYFYQGGGIYKASLSASDASPGLVAGGFADPVAFLNFDSNNLYFADATAQKLWKLGLGGGGPGALVSGVAARDLRFHAGSLYYSDANARQVARIATADGSSSELLTAGSNRAPGAVETDGKTLFWVDDLQINATPIGQPSSRNALGVAGPSPSSGLGHIARLRLSGTRLYWADDAGNLGWTASDGQSCGLFVKLAGGITGWDVDDTAVYALVREPTATELWRIGL